MSLTVQIAMRLFSIARRPVRRDGQILSLCHRSLIPSRDILILSA